MGFIFKINSPIGRKDDQCNCTHSGQCCASSPADLERRRYCHKSAVVGGSLGYIGWEKLTTDKSVVGIVSDAVIGEDTTKKLAILYLGLAMA